MYVYVICDDKVPTAIKSRELNVNNMQRAICLLQSLTVVEIILIVFNYKLGKHGSSVVEYSTCQNLTPKVLGSISLLLGPRVQFLSKWAAVNEYQHGCMGS